MLDNPPATIDNGFCAAEAAVPIIMQSSLGSKSVVVKPSILVLTSTFPRFEDDHEPRFVADLCLNLLESHDVVVLTQHRPGTATEEYYHGIRVMRFRYAPEFMEILSESGGMLNTLKQNPLAWLLVPLFIIAQIFAVSKAISTCKPDIIHSHWIIPQSFSACALRRWSKKARIPLIVTAHGGDIYGFKNASFTRLKKWLVGSCDRLCVVSKVMGEFAVENLDINAEKIAIGPMGVELQRTFVPGASHKRVSGKIAFVGRLVEKKGISYLIEAISILRNSGYRFSLTIAGYGPDEAALKRLCTKFNLQDAVTFQGAQSHKSIANLLQQAEICVLPFVQSKDGDIEGLPVSVLESMGCKCPVIAGNIPGIEDLITDGKTGIICDSTSPKNISDKIISLHQSPDLISQIVENAYIEVHDRYSWRACAERYKNIFKISLPGGAGNS